MPTSFKARVTREPETWIDPEPVGEAMAERLSYEQGLLMSGRAGPHIPDGIQGESTDTEAGYMVDPQGFTGSVQMGATTRFIDDADPAFPSTSVPPSLDDDLWNTI